MLGHRNQCKHFNFTMSNNTTIYMSVLLCLICMKVSSTETGGIRSQHSHLETDRGFDTSNEKISTLTHYTLNQPNQQQQNRTLSVEIVDEAIPTLKEYGSMATLRYSASINGNGYGSAGTAHKINAGMGEGNSKRKHTASKETNIGKRGRVYPLPSICSNNHNMRGNIENSKSKAKSDGSSYKNRKTKDRTLKGSKREGKSKKSKVKSNYDDCSKFEIEQHNRQRALLDFHHDTVLDVAHTIPEISVFMSLLYRFGLTYVLECAGPFTGLIPTNDAFSRLDPITFADLLLPANTIDVEQLLLNHLFTGIWSESDFIEGHLQPLSGFDVSVSLNPLTFNKVATAVKTDMRGSNGVLHLIDGVLRVNAPPVVCDNGEFDFIGPSDGQNCIVNIIDVACNEPELSIFLSLIEAATFENILTCSGPFTVLAPTNRAFNEIGITDVNKWFDGNDIETVTDVLLYHILHGLNSFESLVAGDLESLLAGDSVTVTTNPVKFDNSSVISADIEGCNGVVHILNAVLVPSKDQPSPPQNVSPATVPTGTTTILPSIATTQPSLVTKSPSTGTSLPSINAPTPSDSSTMPSDLPSLAPNGGTFSPTGNSPVAVGTSPTFAPNSIQPAMTPVITLTPTQKTTTVSPIATASPIVTASPTASSSTLSPNPSSTLDTLAPTTSMGSDMPSLLPQVNSESPTVL